MSSNCAHWNTLRLSFVLLLDTYSWCSELCSSNLFFGETIDFCFFQFTYSRWCPYLVAAHGCYKAISGGWIAEGLWDLTGFPTESIWFGARHFDSEATWARLLSFRDQGFLLGAICPASGEGLVGSHAYSVLDVREMAGHAVGEQKHIWDFFNVSQSARKGAWANFQSNAVYATQARIVDSVGRDALEMC